MSIQCEACHGSATTVTGTMGLYGYTPNQPLRAFLNTNGVSGGQSYTKIPTNDEFMAAPTAYWMFPNGSNAKANHYYYNEWAASGHSSRASLTKDSPDAMAFQAAGNGHSAEVAPAQVCFDAKCYECHTGEGYLSSKDAEIAEGFRPPRTTSASWARSAPRAIRATRRPSVLKTLCARRTRPASAAPPASPRTTAASAWTATTGSTRCRAPTRPTCRSRTSRPMLLRATRSARPSGATPWWRSPGASSPCPARSAKTATCR